MKKTLVLGTVALTLILALVLSGCPAEDDSGSVAKVSITITGLTTPPLPAGSQYYSLTVFKQAADIKRGSSMTQLGGFESEGVGAGSSSGRVTIEVSAIPTGNYVLVLGASPGMDGAEGKMFITGTGTGEAATAQNIFLDFGTTGTATVSFDKFATNGADGWTVDEIVTKFNP